jgi:anti-sigma-K factor RskA
MSDHGEVRDLIPGYVLDALEPEESALVREHLSRCAACRRELAGFLLVTDQLALDAAEASAPPSPPRPDLEERILRIASLERARQSMRPAGRWSRGLAAAAAVLIVLLGAGNVLQWTRSPQFQARTKGLVTVAMTGTYRHLDAYGTLVVDVEDNEGVLAVRGLPKLSPDQSYQLWLKKGGQVQSGGLFNVDEDGYGSLLVKIPGGFRGFRAFSISVEPADGSPSPSGSLVLKGGL